MGRPQAAQHEARRGPGRRVARARQRQRIGARRRPAITRAGAVADRARPPSRSCRATAHLPEAARARSSAGHRPWERSPTRRGAERGARPSDRAAAGTTRPRRAGRPLEARPPGGDRVRSASRMALAGPNTPRVEPLVEPIRHASGGCAAATPGSGAPAPPPRARMLRGVDPRDRPRDPLRHGERLDQDRDAQPRRVPLPATAGNRATGRSRPPAGARRRAPS